MQQVSSLYIHFPFCRHLCNYCDFYKHKLESFDQVLSFEKRLELQVKEHENFLREKGAELAQLQTLYIGGGTPSLWSSSGAAFLKKEIIDRYSMSSDCEFTIEVDPGTWTPQEVDSWVGVGVNRFSIGIQSYDKNFLSVLDRKHTMQEATELLNFMQQKKFNFSVDLMLGLPYSYNKEGIKRDVLSEIDKLIEFDPSHFSVYILKTRKNYLHSIDLPSEDYVADEYLKVCSHLDSKMYEQYEVSNFAKNNKKSKHNLKYWNYESVACLGSNATGLIAGKSQAYRYQWKSVGEGLSLEFLEKTPYMIENLYMKLRSSGGLCFSDFSGDNLSSFKKNYATWQARGYIEREDTERVFLSSLGFLMLDSLMDDIFRDLTI